MDERARVAERLRPRTATIGRGLRAVRLGERTRIAVPLTGRDAGAVGRECAALAGHPVDLVEWRLDRFGATPDGPGLARLVREIRRGAGVPVLATLRTRREGGGADVADPDYSRRVLALADAGADAVDVEIARAGAADLVAACRGAGAAVVASHHEPRSTPGEGVLVHWLVCMRDAGADVAKIACLTRTPEDLVALVDAQMWGRRYLGIPVVGIGMGAPGAITRICGERLGCALTFATVGAASAPGQFPVERVARALDAMRPSA